jgi:glucuronosyltransferase
LKKISKSVDHNEPTAKALTCNVFDILALKPKVFITHGGLLSIQEAITFAIPMIVFPIFAEQDYNAARVDRTGRGINLEISTLTLPQLEGAIEEILTNAM